MPASLAEIGEAVAVLTDTFIPPKGCTSEGLVRAYLDALDEHELVDIETTVKRLGKGRIEAASTKFMPTAPELAVYVDRVRSERLGEERKPAAKRYTAAPIVTYEALRNQALERWRDFEVVAEDIDLGGWIRGARTYRWRVGDTWVALLGRVYHNHRVIGAGNPVPVGSYQGPQG